MLRFLCKMSGSKSGKSLSIRFPAPWLAAFVLVAELQISRCSPDLPMAFLHPPRQALCHVREKTFGQATMAFYGLFACHPLTACPTIQLLNSSEVIRQAETDPLVDGTGCEVVPCLKVLQTPCVLHWWIFFYKFHLLRCYQESLQKMCEV